MCKSSYLWRTKPQRDGWDLYFFGLLPSVEQPPGFPISLWICQPSQTSLLANHPQRDAPQRWGGGCFYTSKVPSQLRPGCKWKEWQGFYCWESLNRIDNGWVVASLFPNAAATAAKTKPGAFTRTEEESSSQAFLGSGYVWRWVQK